MPESRDGLPEERQGTCAGCFLCCLAAASTLATCLLVGDDLFIWVVSGVPGQLLGYDLVKLALGIIVYGAMIAPGLLVFWVGQLLLESLGVRIWRPAAKDGRGRLERHAPSDDDADAE